MILQLAVKYPRAFGLAIGLHLLLAVFFVISFDWTAKPDVIEPEVNVVQATAVDESQVQAELAKIREIEARKHKTEEDRVKSLERKADKARREREKEQQRIAQLEKERKVESDRKNQAEQERKLAEEKGRLARKENERLEMERQQAVEAQKQALAERERLEQERVKAEAEAQRAKAEVEKAEAARRKAEEERMRADMLAADQQRLNEQREKQVLSVIQRYQLMIKDKVTRNWQRPPTAKAGMSCDVKVRIIPGGNVLDVRVIKSSGDIVFDRSVEHAVRRAAPLPLPADASLFKHFRELEFTFSPTQ